MLVFDERSNDFRQLYYKQVKIRGGSLIVRYLKNHLLSCFICILSGRRIIVKLELKLREWKNSRILVFREPLLWTIWKLKKLVERWSTNFFADLDSVEVFVLPRLAVIPSAILGYGASSEDRRIVRSQVWIYDQLAVEHQSGSTDRWNGSIVVKRNPPTLVNYTLTIEILAITQEYLHADSLFVKVY